MADRSDYRDALADTGIFETLAGFDPHVAGTPPLGIDMPDSDIDILCHAPDLQNFATTLWQAFHHRDGFRMWQWCGNGRPVIASFSAEGWPFEIFGQELAVARQAGWRHFCIERRLLDLGGEGLREAVMARRRLGAKTEPAFATLLGLPCDPYAALLTLENLPDEALKALISRWNETDRPAGG